mmetsp:Transcript_9405/g.40787  ORF Transcript_9405/g.40787 Transcript_9405/m.40787 type:complete len:102 (+) Transcript_9405:578-883(+)
MAEIQVSSFPKSLGCKAGVVLNPATPVSAIEYVIEDVDLILVMSVNPGFGGQGFINSQVKKIAQIRALCDEKGVNPWIEVRLWRHTRKRFTTYFSFHLRCP